MTKDELLKLVTVLQAELEATNRQVEILSDALAESRRKVAALKINAALDKKAENARDLGLDYEPVQEPVGEIEQIDIDDDGQASAWLRLHNDVEVGQLLYTTPPAAKRQFVGLTDEEFEDIELGCRSTSSGKIEAMQKVEAKLKEKNT